MVVLIKNTCNIFFFFISYFGKYKSLLHILSATLEIYTVIMQCLSAILVIFKTILQSV